MGGPLGTLEGLSTPAVLVDADAVAGNLQRFQAYCDRYGLKARPHAKTHKMPDLAKQQLAAGAVGITCQKLGEAELMAASGIDDIRLTYNLVGAANLGRARALARQCTLRLSADHPDVVDFYAAAFAGERPVSVTVECDTGGGRCGVQTPAEALALAQRIRAADGLRFEGLLTYPAPETVAAVDFWLRQARALLENAGIATGTVSGGNTPDLDQAHLVEPLTEHRAGTYIFNDRSLLERGRVELGDCALRVLTTVVSRPTPQRAILDAGSKTLSSDLFGCEGYGAIVGADGALITSLSEEHAVVDLSEARWQPKIGDRVQVIPNHACVVVNLADTLVPFQGDRLLEPWPVVARGRVQ